MCQPDDRLYAGVFCAVDSAEDCDGFSFVLAVDDHEWYLVFLFSEVEESMCIAVWLGVDICDGDVAHFPMGWLLGIYWLSGDENPFNWAYLHV